MQRQRRTVGTVRFMKVALLHNVRPDFVAEGLPDDAFEEYDTAETIVSVVRALSQLPIHVEPIEADRRLPWRLEAGGFDFVFNMAEGRGRRCREAIPAAVCELLGIPFTGSDMLTLAIALDKAAARRLVSPEVPVARAVLMESAPGRSGSDGAKLPGDRQAKRRRIEQRSRRPAARRIRVRKRSNEHGGCGRLIDCPVLVEEFLSGAEVTVGVAGNQAETRILGMMEIAPAEPVPTWAYSLDVKRDWRRRVRYHMPPRLDASTIETIKSYALTAYRLLGCRDLARLDFRLDATGAPHFLECNPLPGLHPESGDLAILSQRDSALRKSRARRSARCRETMEHLAPAQRTRMKVLVLHSLPPEAPAPGRRVWEFDLSAAAEGIREVLPDAIVAGVRGEVEEILAMLSNHRSRCGLQSLRSSARTTRPRSPRRRASRVAGIPIHGCAERNAGALPSEGSRERGAAAAGVPVPRSGAFPCIVKPSDEHSSAGLDHDSVCEDADAVAAAAARWNGPVVVQEFLPGREFAIALWGRTSPDHFSIGETCFQNGLRLNTYAAKWDVESADFADSPLSYRDGNRCGSAREDSRCRHGGVACRRSVRIFACGLAPRRFRRAASHRRQRQSGAVSRSRDASRRDRKRMDLGALCPPTNRMGALNIRELRPTDRETIREMLHACGAFTDEEVRVAMEVLDDGLAGGLEGDYPLFAAELDGQVRGYVCVGKTPLTRGTWHEYWICVHPAAQRQGVGQALQSHAEEFCALAARRASRSRDQRTRRLRADAAILSASAAISVVGRISDFYAPAMTASSFAKHSDDSSRRQSRERAWRFRAAENFRRRDDRGSARRGGAGERGGVTSMQPCSATIISCGATMRNRPRSCWGCARSAIIPTRPMPVSSSIQNDTPSSSSHCATSRKERKSRPTTMATRRVGSRFGSKRGNERWNQSATSNQISARSPGEPL